MTRRARLVALACCLAAGALGLQGARPPAPRPADAPAGEFSALRARDVLARLLGDGGPHPVGTAANAGVRERLLAELRGLGLAPELTTGFRCNESGMCAPVVNVVARVPGREDGPAVLLAAHYDSVPAGPGAADDGHGAALLLEAVRALQQDGPARHPLWAVWTDGEEPGLLGARALVDEPWFARVGAVVNVEARGTAGASRMFETSDGNAPLIAAYAAGVARPSALSLSYEIYRLLPNDTDLTIYKRAGAPGLNFAFIGGVTRYHTPRDDLAHLDLGSVQQQGDAALGAARALLAADLPLRTDANASYADLCGRVLLRWPGRLDLPLALAALAALLAAAALARRAARPRAVALAALATLLAPLVGGAAGFAALWLVAAASGPLGPWPASSAPLLAAALAAAAATLAALAAVARRVGAPAQALGAWLVWAGLGVALARVLPGATILPVAPALLAAPALLVAAVRPRLLAPAAALPAALALALWAPLVPALPEALGLSGAVVGAAVAWLCTVLAFAGGHVRRDMSVSTSEAGSPDRRDMSVATGVTTGTPDRKDMSVATGATAGAPDRDMSVATRGSRDMAFAAGGLALAALVAAVLAALAPRRTVDDPGKLNLLHVTDLATGEARLVADAPDGLPPAVAAAADWSSPAPAVPWSPRLLAQLPAADPAVDGPRFDVSAAPRRDDGPRELRATLRPRPGAWLMWLVVPAGAASSLQIGGRPLDLATLRRGRDDARVVTIFGPPADGVELVATVQGSAPWVLADAHPGLPASARPVADARRGDHVPYQSGDLTIALRPVVP